MEGQRTDMSVAYGGSLSNGTWNEGKQERDPPCDEERRRTWVTSLHWFLWLTHVLRITLVTYPLRYRPRLITLGSAAPRGMCDEKIISEWGEVVCSLCSPLPARFAHKWRTRLAPSLLTHYHQPYPSETGAREVTKEPTERYTIRFVVSSPVLSVLRSSFTVILTPTRRPSAVGWGEWRTESKNEPVTVSLRYLSFPMVITLAQRGASRVSATRSGSLLTPYGHSFRYTSYRSLRSERKWMTWGGVLRPVAEPDPHSFASTFGFTSRMRP